ncbi:YdbH domain-containing protein [bacterium]|nr:YdbH domain-containing protein [bacterium]
MRRFFVVSLVVVLSLGTAVGGYLYFQKDRLARAVLRKGLATISAREVRIGEVRLTSDGISVTPVSFQIGSLPPISLTEVQIRWSSKTLRQYLISSFLGETSPRPLLPLDEVLLKGLSIEWKEFSLTATGVVTEPESRSLQFLGAVSTPYFSTEEINLLWDEQQATLSFLTPHEGVFVSPYIRVPSRLQGVLRYEERDRENSVHLDATVELIGPHGKMAVEGYLSLPSLAGEVQLSGGALPLPALLDRAREEADLPLLELALHAGTLSPAARIWWDRDLVPTQKYWLTMQQVGGGYQGLSFQEGYGTAVVIVKRSPRGITLQMPPCQFLVREAVYGLSLQNITTQISGELSGSLQQQVRIGPSSFSVPDLETEVALSPLLLRPPNLSTRTTLSTKRLPLAPLLSLIPENPVRGTGSLRGELPLLFSEDGVRIEDGELQAISPGGAIQSSLSPTDPDSPYGFALRALQDYRYDSLRAGVTLETSGELEMAISLSGRSFSVNKDQAINVNLSVVQNLYRLLESVEAVRKYGKQSRVRGK